MSKSLERMIKEQLTEELSFEMILIEGGTFQMGGQDEEADASEKPIHTVDVPTFYMAKFPVTQDIYKYITGEEPSYDKGPRRPVEQVSWEDAKDFIEKLNVQTDQKYRLPSEAEWEFAARGGIYSENFIYAGSDRLKEVAWFRENSGNETHPVGQKIENELGLFDMSGNVFEWCEDDWHENYEGAPTDGSAWFSLNDRGWSRVLRGGSCFSGALGCRVAYRFSNGSLGARNYYFGFRLVLPVQ